MFANSTSWKIVGLACNSTYQIEVFFRCQIRVHESKSQQRMRSLHCADSSVQHGLDCF